MSSPWDLQSDFSQVTDQLQPITLQPADGGKLPRPCPPRWQRRAVTTSEGGRERWARHYHQRRPLAPFGRGFDPQRRKWETRSSMPPPGDCPGQSSKRGWQLAGSRWGMHLARNLAICRGARSIDYDPAEANRQGAPAGLPEPSWANFATDVLARIQSQAEQAPPAAWPAVGHRPGPKVYMQSEMIVDNGFRVVAADGTVWEVEGYQSPDSITDLFTINVMRRPAGTIGRLRSPCRPQGAADLHY